MLLDVELIASIFQEPPPTQGLIASLQGALSNASTLATSLLDNGTPLPTVLLTYYAFPDGSTTPGYYTFGPGTFGQSLVELAGGTSVSANATVAYPELTGSQVLFDDPQVVIYGTGFGIDLSTYQAGPDWGQLPAVHSGALHPIDSNLITEADPTMVLVGLPALTADLHPGA